MPSCEWLRLLLHRWFRSSCGRESMRTRCDVDGWRLGTGWSRVILDLQVAPPQVGANEPIYTDIASDIVKKQGDKVVEQLLSETSTGKGNDMSELFGES